MADDPAQDDSVDEPEAFQDSVFLAAVGCRHRDSGAPAESAALRGWDGLAVGDSRHQDSDVPVVSAVHRD